MPRLLLQPGSASGCETITTLGVGHVCRLLLKVDSVLPADPEAPSNAKVRLARPRRCGPLRPTVLILQAAPLGAMESPVSRGTGIPVFPRKRGGSSEQDRGGGDHRRGGS